MALLAQTTQGLPRGESGQVKAKADWPRAKVMTVFRTHKTFFLLTFWKAKEQ